MIIGTGIRSVRKKLNISQIELARESHISQAAISRFESGTKTPTIQAMKRICATLQVPEAIIYIIGMEATDIPESKIAAYKLVHPTIISLALQLTVPEHEDVLPTE